LKVTVDTEKLADKTDGFSGAELEYLINNTAWDIISSAKIEEKVTINTSPFIKAIKKKKSQGPENEQVNNDLESLNSPVDNENNVESHSSANSGPNVVDTQQLAKVTKLLNDIKTQINALKEEREEKFEEFDSRNSDLEQKLSDVEQNLTKITQCTEEYTQLKDNLKTINEKKYSTTE
jgi:hypothetical protein